ncbi:helix-turn-helix domain-containing protein [Halobaculum litoreum]|uniref:Helix-turn-helix domain-containing protein n=1 Tax=Halobaculum litoreum TaxID=3031998 RepID=A0ABD5XTL0_9EURY
MTESPSATTAPRAARRTDAVDAAETLGLLTDETARAVFEALDEPRTAKEVAAVCDIGLSTAYRKLDALCSLGLCRERILVRTDGHHVTEHVRAVEEVRVAVGADGLEAEVTPRPSGDGSNSEYGGRIASD